MNRPNFDLRQAFASNPTRFLAVGAPRPAAIAALAEVSPSRHAPSAFRQTADASSHPLSDKLRQLGLPGMARTLSRLKTDRSRSTALFDGWLSLLIDGESADRKERRLAARLRTAKLRYHASIADVDYNAARGFDDALFHWLATGQWIADKENVIIDGPIGVGKTWLACALGEKACRDDRSVRYERLPRLLAELGSARRTPQYARRMRALHNTELLILDDWGMEPLRAEQRSDLLEIIEPRYGSGSTLIASQLPVERWPQIIGEPAVAAAILDRIVPNAHRLRLIGASLRGQPAREPQVQAPARAAAMAQSETLAHSI